jgi:hypothetical protein
VAQSRKPLKWRGPSRGGQRPGDPSPTRFGPGHRLRPREHARAPGWGSGSRRPATSRARRQIHVDAGHDIQTPAPRAPPRAPRPAPEPRGLSRPGLRDGRGGRGRRGGAAVTREGRRPPHSRAARPPDRRCVSRVQKLKRKKKKKKKRHGSSFHPETDGPAGNDEAEVVRVRSVTGSRALRDSGGTAASAAPASCAPEPAA